MAQINSKLDGIDLSQYAKKTDLPNLSDYAKKADIPTDTIKKGEISTDGNGGLLVAGAVVGSFMTQPGVAAVVAESVGPLGLELGALGGTVAAASAAIAGFL
mgnify:CR=1 FL=1